MEVYKSRSPPGAAWFRLAMGDCRFFIVQGIGKYDFKDLTRTLVEACRVSKRLT